MGIIQRFLRGCILWIEQCGQIPQVLPGMIEIDNLHSARKVLIGEIPDPDRTVANDDFGGGPFPAPAPRFGVEAVAEFVGGFDSAHIGSGIRVADGPSIFVHGGLREYDSEFALACAGALSFDSADPALGFCSHNRDVDPIHEHIHFQDVLFGDNGQDELFGAVDLLLFSSGDFRANALRRPFDGFSGDFQTRQHLHRFARRHERHLGADHCFHASDTG